jgi:hypothetical protein
VTTSNAETYAIPRKHPRISTELAVQLEQTNPTGLMRFYLTGRSLNISRGGLLAEVQTPLLPCQTIGVEVQLDSERLMLWTRQVRSLRVGPHCHQIALEFDERCEAALARLQQLVDGKTPGL